MSSESCTQSSLERVSDQDASDSALVSQPAESTRSKRSTVVGGGLLLLGVALAAANMRPAVTSLASVLGEVRDSLGVSSAWASVITSVPTVCFGLVGFFAPMLAGRWGLNRAIGVSLAVLTGGMVLRVLDGPWTVLSGMVLACSAIAMCNVLIPVVVKASFAGRIGLATAVYTTTMAAGGAVGSTFTPWLRSLTESWRFALLTWTVLAIAALCVWIPATRELTGSSAGIGSTAQHNRGVSMLRNPLAWLVTLYFGFQSLVAYVVMGWLPEVLKGAGMDSGSAGALLGLLLVIGVPMNLVLPMLVTRTRTQSGWAVALGVCAVSGFLGLLLAPMSLPVLWALLIGTGMAAFPLALIIISLRTNNASETSDLSAMAQSVGYLIASTGPMLFGLLHEVTGGWSVPLIVIVLVVTAQSVVGVVVGRPRTVTTPAG